MGMYRIRQVVEAKHSGTQKLVGKILIDFGELVSSFVRTISDALTVKGTVSSFSPALA